MSTHGVPIGKHEFLKHQISNRRYIMASPATKNPYPWWKVKIWHGMSLMNWLALLWRYSFAIDLRRLHRFISVLIVSISNQLFAFAQWARFTTAINRTVPPTPIFIIGHWRTGTTFLHELIAADRRFITPTALQCMCPDHFLLSRPIMSALEFMLPKNRPMDDFEISWDAPQEDEFALLTMGARSPYELFGFPHSYGKGLSTLNVNNLNAQEQKSWRLKFEHFLKLVTFDSARRNKLDDTGAPLGILLKSPTHTARLGLLAKLYPHARFIHLTRDRHTLFASSVSLWRALLTTQALHTPPEGLGSNDFYETLAFDAFDALYENFDHDRSALKEGRLIDVKFSELTSEPLETVKRIYRFLDIKLDDRALESLEQKTRLFETYQGSNRDLDQQLSSKVDSAWADYPDRFVGSN